MRAIILAGTGAAGRAVAAELARAGSDVLCTGRDPARFPASLAHLGVRFTASDRHAPDQLAAVLADGADLIVDCGCFSAAHALHLLEHRGSWGSAVMLSGKAVYVDAAGRHANSADPPHFPDPIREDQPVMEPDFSGDYASRSGYGANKVAAELTLLDSGAAVTILRPGLIHGPGSRQPREWFVLKRLLHGRSQIPLAHRGATANHPTAAANLARLVAVCAQRPERRVLNVADPDAPDAAAVARAIARVAGRKLEIVGLDDAAPAGYGRSPWASWPPVRLDTTAAVALGYEPAGGYVSTVGAAVDDLAGLSDAQAAELGLDRSDDYRADDAALRYAGG